VVVDLISIGEMSDRLADNRNAISWNKLCVCKLLLLLLLLLLSFGVSLSSNHVLTHFRNAVAKVLRGVNTLQSTPFRYQGVPIIVEFLDSVRHRLLLLLLLLFCFVL
jgi:hypothetical protein